MEEEIKNEEAPPEPTETPVQPQEEPVQELDLVAKANEAAARLEAANKEHAALIAKQEKLAVKNTFAGRADAGQKPLSEEDQKIASARKMLEGTGFEDMFDEPEKK